MINLFQKIFTETQIPSAKETSPTTIFWIGACSGLFALPFFLVLWTAYHADYGIGSIPVFLIAIIISIVSFFVFRWLSDLVLRSALAFPRFVFGAFGSSIGLFFVLRNIRFYVPDMFFYLGGFALMLAVGMVFGFLFVLIRGAFSALDGKVRGIISVLTILSLAYIGFASYWLFSEGNDPYEIEFEQVALADPISSRLSNPGAAGSMNVITYSYGSGVNNQRSVYGEDIKYTSETVDGTYVLPQWKGKNGSERERYWGFGIKDWPLNGMVWMPEGDGPFPLVLIVHGNHSMTDYSDPGYAYLGEMLASRGYITVSVDENFINGAWSGDFRGRELPARAWLLLKHLEQWRTWSADAGHELYNKADLDNVLLVGHSRGGEAVPIAAAFNKLPYHPDDARVKFDFNFGIKGIVAIAPTDYRYDRRVEIENVDFLGIQGSYDSDEDSFFGLRQLQRSSFTDSLFHLKAGIYLHGANHGQFNSGWGRHDSGFPGKYFLNTAPMISGDDQRSYAKVAIGAFAEVSLKGDQSYLPVFQDIRHASAWLPENTLAQNIYQDTRSNVLVDFEGDIDIVKTKVGNAKADNLSLWKEDFLQYRGGKDQDNNVLILGWKNDSSELEKTYQVNLENPIDISEYTAAMISIAKGDPALIKDLKEDEMSTNFRLVLTDSSGTESVINIESYKKIAPRLKIRYLKTKSLTTERYKNEWEPMLETFLLPLDSFEGIRTLDASSISRISLEFPNDSSGVVMIDNIGFR